ncbi:MAG: gliding motility protein [Pseudarcicella sp.]|nr:gliding motility protein [Pseudarcicella sp.]MBP6410891.1 gliding motility protein [Pseudarcicella sp.]
MIKHKFTFDITLNILLLSLFFCTSCKYTDNKEDSIKKIDVNISITPMDSLLFNAKNANEVLSILTQHSSVVENYFKTSPQKFQELAPKVFSLVNNPSLKDFYKQSKEKTFFGNNQLRTDFEEAFRHIKYYYPNFKEPKIYTFFTGFGGGGMIPNTDLFVSDSVILVGLDYFMGKKAKYLPDVFDYQLKQLTTRSIVPKAVMFLSQKYNMVNHEDRTLLADMVYFGKSLEFAQTMSPSIPDSTIIGYTHQEMEDTHNFQDDVWAYFIDNKLLFATDEPKKSKMLGARPNTSEIGTTCPGSVGKWLGWRIVKKYLKENKKVTLQELMKSNDANQILQLSQYKGLIDEE